MSKPGITMVDGSSAGFQLSGFGGMGSLRRYHHSTPSPKRDPSGIRHKAVIYKYREREVT